ncbi:MAG: chorismate synthase [Clostridia bacterium]|nr:chorismate synthase [Clostridia bacterium]
MSCPYGINLKLRIDGGSHDEYMTGTMSGFPAGVSVDPDKMRDFLLRRAPGRDPLATARRETDEPEFIRGITDGVTDGGIIEFRIFNRDSRPSDYNFNDTPRPSHADLAAVAAYGKNVDLRGGGHFSGRLTAILCVAGFLAKQFLAQKGIFVIAHALSVGTVNDTPFDPVNVGETERSILENKNLSGMFPVLDTESGERMRKVISDAKADLNSIGGVIECAICGIPAGLGEHMFAGLEARISSAVFAIPAVKGIEFGSGFSGSEKRGSENNDPIITDGKHICTETNNCGGILGGMSDGMPIIFRAAIKPTPTIGKEQHTVSLSQMKNVTVKISGRHDPCIVPRAVPAAEAAAAIAVCDVLLDPVKSLRGIDAERGLIDLCDRQITDAFIARCSAVRRIGHLKKASMSSVFVPERESELKKRLSILSGENSDNCLELYDTILRISRNIQTKPTAIISGFSNKKVFLIGHPLGHSISPKLHGFLADYKYSLKDLSGEELPAFLQKKDFDALNVTVPYKRDIIPFLDTLSPTAAHCGAVNTVLRLEDGRLAGFNTDVYGFDFLLRFSNISVEGKDVVILGTGGAAAAVREAVTRQKCRTALLGSRRNAGDIGYDNLKDIVCKNTVIVNATPVGMYPHYDECPLSSDIIAKAGAVIDLTYNPFRTTLICLAEELGIPACGGLPMLAAQAAQTCGIVTGKFTSESVSDEEAVVNIIRCLKNELRHIVLIGMPGCGKSTAARRLAEILDRQVIDTDEEIFYSSGKTPEQIIRENGEEEFRKIEHRELLRALRHSPAVIAAGGGIVTREDNYLPLRQVCAVVLLNTPLEKLSAEGRPLTQSEGVERLFEQRYEKYIRFSDFSVDTDSDTDVTVRRIIEVIQ